MSARFGIVAFLALLMGGCADPSDPPPAAFMPACDGCGSYTAVWFENDSAELTANALHSMNALLPLWTEGKASLNLIGHADVAGTARRNLELSRARAESLRAYLERNGMSAGTIFVEARGNTRRLVQAPKPNEVQNQRVEVMLLTYAARPPCYKEHDKQLVAWYRRNCVPQPLIGRSKDCAYILTQLPPTPR